MQKQILEDLVHQRLIGFFCEWCDTPKKEKKGIGYLDVTIIYYDDDVQVGECHWYFVEDTSHLPI